MNNEKINSKIKLSNKSSLFILIFVILKFQILTPTSLLVYYARAQVNVEWKRIRKRKYTISTKNKKSYEVKRITQMKKEPKKLLHVVKHCR